MGNFVLVVEMVREGLAVADHHVACRLLRGWEESLQLEYQDPTWLGVTAIRIRRRSYHHITAILET